MQKSIAILKKYWYVAFSILAFAILTVLSDWQLSREVKGHAIPIVGTVRALKNADKDAEWVNVRLKLVGHVIFSFIICFMLPMLTSGFLVRKLFYDVAAAWTELLVGYVAGIFIACRQVRWRERYLLPRLTQKG